MAQISRGKMAMRTKDPIEEVLQALLLARCVLEDAYDVADWKYKKDLLYLMRGIDDLSELVKEMEGAA
jgi:hypothetical protein